LYQKKHEDEKKESGLLPNMNPKIYGKNDTPITAPIAKLILQKRDC